MRESSPQIGGNSVGPAPALPEGVGGMVQRPGEPALEAGPGTVVDTTAGDTQGRVPAVGPSSPRWYMANVPGRGTSAKPSGGHWAPTASSRGGTGGGPQTVILV